MFQTDIAFRLYRFFKLFLTQKVYIYLTFDDGPLNGTRECFNLCKFHDVKASYFMVGAHLINQKRKQLVEEISNCENKFFIGNHSYSHANEKYTQFYSNPIHAKLDFEKAAKLFDFKNKVIRLPGYNAWVFTNSIKAQLLVMPLCKLFAIDSYTVIGWDIEWNFRKMGSTESNLMIKLFKNQLLDSICRNKTFRKNHIVVLMHDINFADSKNCELLAELISYFKRSRKFEFEILSNYPC